MSIMRIFFMPRNLFRLLSMSLIGLLLCTCMSQAYPVDVRDLESTTTLSRWLLSQSLSEEGESDPAEASAEAVSGIHLISRGTPVRVVHSILNESYRDSVDRRKIEFVGEPANEGVVTTARFRLIRNPASVFSISHDSETGIISWGRSEPYISPPPESEETNPALPYDGPYVWHGTRMGLLRTCMARDGLYGYTPTPSGRTEGIRVTVTGQKVRAMFWSALYSRHDLQFEADYEDPTVELEEEDTFLSDVEREKEDKFAPTILEFKNRPLLDQFNFTQLRDASQEKLAACPEIKLHFRHNKTGRTSEDSNGVKPVDLNLLSFTCKCELILQLGLSPAGSWYPWMDSEWSAAYEVSLAAGELTSQEERQLYGDHVDERSLLATAAHHLAGIPVNMLIDVSAIPFLETGQIRNNMTILAHLIAWHDLLGMDIRYMLEKDTTGGRALNMLKEELAKLATVPGINVDELLAKVAAPHPGDGVITVALRTASRIRGMEDVGKRELLVALKGSPKRPGISIPDYASASSIGLSMASLVAAGEETSANGEYERARLKAFQTIRDIYRRAGIIKNKDEFTVEDLEFMISGCAENKLSYALLYAFPPIVKDLTNKISEYFRQLNVILQAA